MDKESASNSSPDRSSTLDTINLDEETSMKHSRSVSDPKTKEHKDSPFESVSFRDFSQPSVKKTGYLIPLKSGHNGEWSRTEKTLLEVHLVNAGVVEI